MKNRLLRLMVNYWYMIQQVRNRGNTERRTAYLPMRMAIQGHTGLVIYDMALAASTASVGGKFRSSSIELDLNFLPVVW